MPDTHRNLEIVRDLYDRYIAGDDPEAVLDSLAHDVEWRSVAPPEQLRFARPCHGRDAVRAYFGTLTEDWEMISYHVNELIAQGDRVVALADACFCHKDTGKIAATPKADVFRLRDGKIVEFCEFFDSAAVVEAATEAEAWVLEAAP